MAELWTHEPNLGRISHLFRGDRSPDIATTLRPPSDLKKRF